MENENLNENNQNEPENESNVNVNETDRNDDAFSALSDRMNSIEEMLTSMGAMISTIQKAQENFVAMGGSIHETNNDSDTNESDDMLPLDLLDWNI